MRSVAMTPADTSQWDSLQWRRRLERFGEDDGPIVAAGPNGEVDGVWWVESLALDPFAAFMMAS